MSILRIFALGTVWCVLTRELTLLNVALGVILSWLLVSATSRSDERASRSLESVGFAAAVRRALVRPVRALELAAFFVHELVWSNARTAVLVIRPRLRLNPMIVEVEVDAGSDAELALLSDLVSLTPGTLTLDVSDDGRTLFVHVLSAEDPREVRRHIRDGLGRRVRRLFE